jgi:hypothetical protein
MVARLTKRHDRIRVTNRKREAGGGCDQAERFKASATEEKSFALTVTYDSTRNITRNIQSAVRAQNEMAAQAREQLRL